MHHQGHLPARVMRVHHVEFMTHSVLTQHASPRSPTYTGYAHARATRRIDDTTRITKVTYLHELRACTCKTDRVDIGGEARFA